LRSTQLRSYGMVGITRWFAISLLGGVAAVSLPRGGAAESGDRMRVGFQRSSTLISLLKRNGELDKALGRWACA
jgi:hypothetical protein